MSDEANNANATVWDDSLLVKTYDESVGLAREALARRLADSTNKRDEENASVGEDVGEDVAADGEEPIQTQSELVFTEGDYARATYTDGLDYEGTVLSINEKKGTCVIRYLGYENEQEVPLADLLPTWGKKARRDQFLYAKEDEKADQQQQQPSRSKASSSSTNQSKKSSGKPTGGRLTGIGGSGGLVMPPMPLVPPTFTAQAEGGEQDFVAMLTAWYMSGYYTGLYQGKKEATNACASAKKKSPRK
ncbi:hypothetical protein KR009_004259 [Drosophila setifemur]|nr:hypothetical protein KR009_004259 [Drosophila setifemur]